VPGCSTTPGRPSACVCALEHIAFRYTDSVGTRNQFSIAAQWLACTFPCRRFADILADACARLGAEVVRYSFIVVELHHLLLAGLPAQPCENVNPCEAQRICFSCAAAPQFSMPLTLPERTSEGILFSAICSAPGFYTAKVESECGAVAVGRTYLLPPLSFGAALLVRPWLRFHIHRVAGGSRPPPAPTERSMRICRTTLFGS
jgi:hypothetical protein